MPENNLRECRVCELGRITYSDAFALQRRLVQAIYEGKTGDTLLLLEHPPTITLGRFAKRENILASPALLVEQGVEVQSSDRGGDVTFHCPGQMVIYPVLDLHKRDGMVRAYISNLEEVALNVLRSYGINAERWPEHPGLWLGDKQIGALGLHFTRGISMHGLALNVCPDLGSFRVINLCGLPGKRAASISSETGRKVSVEECRERLKESFATVFKVRLKPVSKEQLEGACREPEIARVV